MERGREEIEETKNRTGKKRRGGMRWAKGPRNCAFARSIPRGKNNYENNYENSYEFFDPNNNIRGPYGPEMARPDVGSSIDRM